MCFLLTTQWCGVPGPSGRDLTLSRLEDANGLATAVMAARYVVGVSAGVSIFLVVTLAGYSIYVFIEWHRFSKLLTPISVCKPEVHWAQGHPVEIYLHGPFENFALDDEKVASLVRVDTLRIVSIKFAPYVTDRGVSALAKLPCLTVLGAQWMPITDAALVPFEGHGELARFGSMEPISPMPGWRTSQRCPTWPLLRRLHAMSVTPDF